MTSEDAKPRSGWNLFYLAGIGWLLLSALAFWAYYSGQAPFNTLGIPVSQLALVLIFTWIGWRRARKSSQ